MRLTRRLPTSSGLALHKEHMSAAVSGHRFNRLISISDMLGAVRYVSCRATVIATHTTSRELTLTLITQQQQPYLPRGSHFDTVSEIWSNEVRRFRSVMRLLSSFAGVCLL